jgi:hypothetical protein
MTENEPFDFGIEVKLPENNNFSDFKDRTKDGFLVVKETLTRIGIASKKTKTLYQSCHILHKKSKYYIVTFKELFKLDGKPADITEDDIARRNTIVKLLAEWKLLEIIDKEKAEVNEPPPSIRVISYKDKANWVLSAKYQIGTKS